MRSGARLRRPDVRCRGSTSRPRWSSSFRDCPRSRGSASWTRRSNALRRVDPSGGCIAQADDAEPCEETNDLPRRVDLEPAMTEVRAHRVLVMVVLEQLSEREEVED